MLKRLFKKKITQKEFEKAEKVINPPVPDLDEKDHEIALLL